MSARLTHSQTRRRKPYCAARCTASYRISLSLSRHRQLLRQLRSQLLIVTPPHHRETAAGTETSPNQGSRPLFFCQSWQIFFKTTYKNIKVCIIMWKCLENSVTSGNFLEFPAIPAKNIWKLLRKQIDFEFRKCSTFWDRIPVIGIAPRSTICKSACISAALVEKIQWMLCPPTQRHE
jgi:hypothetical protein